MSDQPTPDVDVEALKAQHLNQALAFVEEALGEADTVRERVSNNMTDAQKAANAAKAEAVFAPRACLIGGPHPDDPALKQGYCEATIEARAQARFDALLEAHRQWAATEGPTFTLAILNARTAREQQEAVYNAMQGAFLAGAMAMQEEGK